MLRASYIYTNHAALFQEAEDRAAPAVINFSHTFKMCLDGSMSQQQKDDNSQCRGSRQGRTPLSRTRSFLYYVVIALAVGGFGEVSARLTYYLIFHESYGAQLYKALPAGRVDQPKVTNKQGPRWLEQEILHPYLGYTIKYGSDYSETFGFANNFDITQGGDPQQLTVLLTGGSVAMGLGREDALEAALNGKLRRNGDNRTVRVYNAAVLGYKQPQQLLLVNYFLSAGAKFDAVINLDGFNEVVLPYSDNTRFGINPLYPRLWGARVARKSGTVDNEVIEKIASLREQRSDILTKFEGSIVRFSAIPGILARLIVVRYDNRIIELNRQVVDWDRIGFDFELMGPQIKQKEQNEIIALSAANWKISTILLNNLLKSMGIEYFHFLQPNQYVAGSKKFTREEEGFFLPKSDYGDSAQKGYPLLIKMGHELTEQGLQFSDMTMLFANIAETVYMDACCHLNLVGNKLLAEAIADKVSFH